MLSITVTTFESLEEILADELRQLGAQHIDIGRRAVFCQGDKKLLYRANLELRTGIRVLLKISEFKAHNEQKLYDKLKSIDWSQYLAKDGTMLVDVVTLSERHRNSFYLSQLTKDAVVDQFRERTGERPSVSKNQPDLKIHLYISKHNEVTVSLDSSGEGLHRRGYRRRTGGAPLNEVLAAGLLKLAEYDGEQAFVDPMCGSGTLVIEAAMIATRRAPGLHRSFGFEKWPDFSIEDWSSIRQSALDRIRSAPHPVIGSDIDPLTISLARVAVERAHVHKDVSLEDTAFKNLTPPASEGLLVTNPPYEMRLKTGNIEAFYQEMGDVFKSTWTGYTAWIISGNPEAIKSVGLRTSRKIMVMNGPMEARFCKYELYRGTKKEYTDNE